MKSKEYFGYILFYLIYLASLNKGANTNDLTLEDRLMKLESTVGQLKENDQEMKEKMAAMEEKIITLEIQNEAKVDQIRILEEEIEILKDDKKVFPGQDVPRTCHELWRMGETVDGEYEVDPDGNNNGYPPIKVQCTFHQDGADTYIPLAGVDLHETLDVDTTSCHGSGCFNVQVNYTSPVPQIVALIDLSRDCQQFIEYGCENAPLEVNGLAMGWWTDRDSNPQYYWTNTTENKHICSCGLDSSCVEFETFGNLCNCDANLPIKEIDQGYIRNSSALPITELSAGTFYGKASFSLGHMKCFGEAPYNNGESCDAYRKAGATLSGYYLTMPGTNSTNSSSSIPQVSLCDMTKSSKDPEFQTDIGALGEFGKSMIAFNAIRSSEFSETNANLTFDNTTVNIGNAFDPHTGIFTAPVAGLYNFAFHGFSNYASNSHQGSDYWSRFKIYKNGEILATAIANNYYYNSYYVAYQSFSTSFYEFLDLGDDIFIMTGDYSISLYDSSSEHVTQFSGSLLQ